MATLDDFMPLVLPFVSGCPEPTAYMHVRNSLAAFCASTRCWTFQVRNLEATTSSRIAIPVPPGTVIHDVAKCWLDGRELEPVAFDSVDPDEMDEVSMPRFFTQARPGEISLVPRGEGMLRLHVYLKPSVHPMGRTYIAESVYSPDTYEDVYFEGVAQVAGTLEIPDFLIEQYGQAIGDGAVARIKMIPNQPWTDPGGAQAHQGMFMSAMDTYFARNLTGQQRAPRRSRGHYL